MPTVYVLMGPPGSGKTTWRRAFLAARGGAALAVARDDVVEEFAAAHGLTYGEAWRAFAKPIDKEYRRRLTDVFAHGPAHGLDVVVDATNVTPKARRRILSRVPPGWERVGVLFEAPDEVLHRRLRDRAAGGGKRVPHWLIAVMRADWVPPEPGEFDRLLTVRP